MKKFLTLIAALLVCGAVESAQKVAFSQREIRDPRQLETHLEANATDAETRIAVLETSIGTNAATAAVTVGSLTVNDGIAVNTNATGRRHFGQLRELRRPRQAPVLVATNTPGAITLTIQTRRRQPMLGKEAPVYTKRDNRRRDLRHPGVADCRVTERSTSCASCQFHARLSCWRLAPLRR